ncbi:TRAP transporter large permease [Aminobacter sp. SR38]|jgi:tripartite ATP-independent transporter DctM subunit|uniref:TRAP transporter large permease n=1 Tax=Aminobacter sp. SR38 TaxID=2774562 RepID=UPI00177CFCF6|nr:TRAP transporter large permease [Aminobacter sp. SR38]QOF69462.1 TRAP transporter large permease [Aminobacter sp. SR38]
MLFLALAVILTLCVLALMGMPIIVALASSVIVFLMVSGGWELSLPQQVLSGISDYVLITLPLFILAGGIMNASGIADRLFDLAAAIFGWMRGGLAHVDIAVSVMFGGMIGTSVADLAGSASVIIPKMKKNGYPGPFAAALSATSSGIGILVPPSSPMILYSAVTGTSLGALFLAGLVPGLVLAGTLMLTVAILARKNDWKPMQCFAWHEVMRTGKRALLPMGLPGLILGGLVFGILTPSEAGAFAVAYALLLSMAVYKTLTFRDLRTVLVEATVLTGEVMLVVGFSVALGWALSEARVPVALADLMQALFPFESTVPQIMLMLLLALIAGMVLDPLIPMIMPILLPSLMALDIDLVHFGVLMVVTVVLGQVTPPVALALIVAARIGKEDVIATFRANTPFLIAMFLFLLLLIFVPSIATWLPNLVM